MSSAALRVVDPGPFATVQDLGRPGHRSVGVPIGGAFDFEAHAVANALVANQPTAATLEVTVAGGVFEVVEGTLALGLSGAARSARVQRFDGATFALGSNASATLGAGDRLILGKPLCGRRVYLAVAGGWLTADALGSRSSEVRLERGHILRAVCSWVPARRLGPDASRRATGPTVVRVIDGPDQGNAPIDWAPLLFRVGTASNRIGIRLEGPTIPIDAPVDRLSTPVAPGAVQVAGGRAIVLGVAGGTMGGYPHVAHVASVDLPLLAQLNPGDEVRFQRIDRAEAVRLDAANRSERSGRLLRIRCAAGDGLIPSTID